MYIYLIIPHTYIQTLDSPSVRQLQSTPCLSFNMPVWFRSICDDMPYDLHIYIYDSVLGVVHISCVLCMHIFICDRYNINKNIKQ